MRTLFLVTLSNFAGPLSNLRVKNEVMAADAAIRMIREAGELHEGDLITVKTIEIDD